MTGGETKTVTSPGPCGTNCVPGLLDTGPSGQINIFSRGKLVERIGPYIAVDQSINPDEWMELQFTVPVEPGFYEIRLSVSDELMPPTINSSIIELRVKEAN